MTGLGAVTVTNTFAGSLGLSINQQHLAFGIGVLLMLVGVAIFIVDWRLVDRRRGRESKYRGLGGLHVTSHDQRGGVTVGETSDE